MKKNDWSSGDTGSFVSLGDEHGIGRLAGIDSDGMARIRYFRGPALDPFVERWVDPGGLQRVALSTHTRVYVRHPNRWAIGRIEDASVGESGSFVVAFPNGEGRLLSADQFEVRWARPVEDPFEFLIALGGDSPVVYEQRLGVISGWHRQHAAAVGAEGLLLGSVELHDHQLTAVRRVAEDGNRRYLLADEVGLGKTIEAGALIWQCFNENPEARVLVISPDHLRQQWAEELTERFRLGTFRSGWLRIGANDAPDTWPSESVDVLVVDEAHHLTRAGNVDPTTLDRLATIALRAKAVLLLSATPVRSNEAGFLDLLHLLDPTNYRRDDVAGFTELVAKRDRLALIFQALLPGLDAFDVSLFGEELEGLFPNDDLLSDLVARAMDADDQSRPDRISQIRDHLSETYRLHHRLLRTRRDDQLQASFGVRGRKRGRPFMFEIDDECDGLRVGLLDDLRSHLAALVEADQISVAQGADCLAEFAARCGSLPHALVELAESGGEFPLRAWLDEQGQTWAESLAASTSVQTDRVAAKLIDRTLSRVAGKVVVVSSYTPVAAAVAEVVEVARGKHRVARHLHTATRKENAAELARWNDDPMCVLLFCDASAEEGINLQAADRMVHLDLPWDVFRLEQRIGRIDRFAGRDKLPVESHVLMHGEQRYAQEWFGFVADACEVFDRSVSSLQHVLADAVRDVAIEVVKGGPAVFDDQFADRRRQLANERDRITAHDALDSVARKHDGVNGRLLNADADRTFQASFTGWFSGVGARLRKPHPGVIKVSHKPRPQIPFDLEVEMAEWFGQPLAVERGAAVEHRLPLARAGHGLVDAVAKHLENDDRGLAYAYYRPAPDIWPPIPTFRVDALVLPIIDPEFLAAAEAAGLAGWLTQWIDTATPPVVEQAYLLADGTEIADEHEVSRPYDKNAGDQNLISRPVFFEKLTEHLDWESTCDRASSAASAILNSRPSVTDEPKAAADALVLELERRDRQLRARGAAGFETTDAGGWAALAAAVPELLERRVRLLGCGVTIHGDLRKGGLAS
jgi:ATP-dependent helicase HepA